MASATGSLLRERGHHDSGRVSMVELFFDLVFVFAVTQLSHTLLEHLTPLGAAQTALLLPAIWWVWIYTSWVTNWLNPERMAVRLCLFALMLAGLVMAAAIPHAFEARGIVFACAFVLMQVGRTVFMLWAIRNGPPVMVRTFQRILVWFLISGIFWILGAWSAPSARFDWWALAMMIELVAPLVYFWVPGLGRSRTADWDIDGAHLAERCALFVIIALGESLLITGATFAELHWSWDAVTGMLIAVLGSIAMWWMYFDTGAERARHRIVHANDPGRQGRMAYTYLHLPIVAGIIICATADEIVLMHPHHADTPGIVVILAGPFIYLSGNALFKWVTNDRRAPPLSHLVGLALLAILTPFAFSHVFTALALSTLTTTVFVLVAGWEAIAIRRGVSR
jgi:low temperature requirement protein LtrA